MELLYRKAYIAVLIVLTSSLLPICAAYAASPQVRVSIDRNQSYWAGQKIPFYIDLLSPGFFSGTPKFDLPAISGVLVMKIPGSPVMGTEEIEGHSFTKQRHEFVLFSQRPGQVNIPSFTVKYGVSGQVGEPPKEVALKTSSLTLMPKMPPGAEKLTTIISTRDLKVTESWNPEPKDSMTGDAFTRTITFQAPDIPGMAFTPFSEMNINGLGIYAETPAVNDQMERGNFIGQRTEKITYVMENVGKIIIPAISFHWFDLDSKTLKTEELQEVEFIVKASTIGQSSGKSAMIWSLNMYFVMVFVLIVIAGAVLWRWRNYLMNQFKSWQEHQKKRESHYFKRFTNACRNDDPNTALNALMAWADRVNPDRQAATLNRVAKTWGDAELASEIIALQKAAFYQEKNSDSGKKEISWSGRKLKPLTIIARKRLNKSKYKQKTMAEALMPLNPL